MLGKRRWRILARVCVCVCVFQHVGKTWQNKHKELRIKIEIWNLSGTIFMKNIVYQGDVTSKMPASVWLSFFRSCLESKQKGTLCTTLWVRLWGGYGMDAQHSGWDCGVAVGDVAQHSGWDCGVAVGDVAQHSWWDCGVAVGDVAQHSGWDCEVAMFTITCWNVVQIGQKSKTPDTDQGPKPEEPKIILWLDFTWAGSRTARRRQRASTCTKDRGFYRT